MAETQYGDLTLTTQQIQTRLNQVPTNTEAIAALQQAITAFLNTEQVQALITAALADYSTTAEVTAAIASALTDYYTKTAADALLNSKVDKVSGKQLSTEDFTTALKTKLNGLPNSTELATQISTAITTALADYYTKTAADALLGNKVDKESGKGLSTNDFTTALKNKLDALPTAAQLATQISTAITTALADYVTTSDFNNAISGLQQRVSALEEAVSGIEMLAEGYVRVAGSSNPALSYAHYKFNQEGAFSRESAFSLFYPCLVGTKLTGGNDQVGKILHILQKLDYNHDINGNVRAIDGSEGDVMICNIEKYYRLAGKYTVSGTEYDVFLMSREPFAWQGHEAEEVDKFGWAPDYCVSHEDTDNVVRMHSVYNPAWNGSYQAPVGVEGKYVYSQNEETGVISEVYDANETLLGGAGGLHTTDKTLPAGEQEAMNQNPDTTKTIPFYNATAEGCNAMQALLLAEGGTFDAHKATLMGSGFSANDVANESTFEESGSEARNGMRYENSLGETVYVGFSEVTAGSAAAFMLNISSTAAIINGFRNPWHIMEAHRAMSHAISHGVGELQWFVFEGNKYKYRSVTGFNGPANGEMTCVVFKQISTRFTSDAKDPQDISSPLTGRRVDFIVSTALFHGMTTQVSPSWWTSGLIFTEDENGDYLAYMERDQELLVKSPTAAIDADASYNFETVYPQIGEKLTNGRGYAKNYLNGALMMPNTNANKTGGGLHTYVCKYNYFTGSAAAAGKKQVRGFRRGYNAVTTYLSPLTVNAYNAPSFAFTNLGFGTCVRIVN